MGAKRRRVVIVGGGFGGIEAAKALADVPVDVFLVDRANYHLFQPLLYQVAMAGLSPAEIASPIRGILAEQKNARVELGEVTRVDLEQKKIWVEGEAEAYDWLILAVGARTTYFGHDEWERWAPSLKTVEDALEIRRRVLLAFERAERIDDQRERRKQLTFAVIGGGPTGVELAGAIAELARFVLSRDFRSADPRDAKVILIEAGPRILPSFPEDLAQRAVEQLAELGVEVQTGSKVVRIDEKGVELEGDSADDLPGLGSGRERERIAAATVVWGAGVQAGTLAKSLGVPLDRQGRVIVEQDCSVPGHREVFAIGDMAHFDDNRPGHKGPLPGVSPVAMQQARYVAKIVRTEAGGVRDIVRKEFSYFDKGSMATIGRSRAIAMAGKMKMSGFIAWLAWLFIHLVYLIGFRNRIVVLWNWTWSYLSYQRGARLITSTGWHPQSVQAPTSMRSPLPAPAPSPPEGARSPEPGRRKSQAATPTS